MSNSPSAKVHLRCLPAVETLERRDVPSFVAPSSYPVGDAPVAVLRADFNADGLLDLATANATSSTVSVLLGLGDGYFRPANNFATGRGTNSLAAADFDADCLLDLATADAAGQSVSVLRGNGDGTFQLAVSYPAGPLARSVVAADFNSDGWADLAVANPQAGTLGLLFNQGDGSFATPQTFAVGSNPRSLLVSDHNADGVPDLSVTLENSSTIALFLGVGDGTFLRNVDQATGRFPTAQTSADFNADGLTDLAVATIDGGTVLLSNGDGTFVRRDAPLDVQYYITAIAAGDFNGDGIIDLALGGADAEIQAIYGGLSIQLGYGDGTFDRISVYDATVFTADLLADDFNQDGYADLAAASFLRVCDDECSVYANSLLVLRGSGDRTGDWQRAPVVNGGRSPNSVTFADLNGDGWMDMLTGSFNGVGVLLGSGSSFGTPRFVQLQRTPFALATGDFNGDGIVDVAAIQPATFPTYTNGELNILLGNGDGTFQPVRVFGTNSWPADLAAGDVNGDGFPDLIVVNARVRTQDPSSLSVFVSNGDGDFTLTATYETGSGNWGAVSLADFNGDGFSDVAAVLTSNIPANGGLYVLLSNGDGTLQEPVHYSLGMLVQSIAAGDFNTDGWMDLAAGAAAGLHVLLGNGDGTFQPALFNGLARGFSALHLGDFNADGIFDLTGVGLAPSAVTVVLGNGDGTFRMSQSHAVRQAPRDVGAADFNGDGWTDLAVASNGTWPSYSDGGISLLFNDGNWSAAPLPGSIPGLSDVVGLLQKKS